MIQTEQAAMLLPSATPLAQFIASTEASKSLAVYRGALTPIDLDVREREIEALACGAAVHDLGWMRRIAVRGEDRFRWLSGMVTNTVNDLGIGAGAWNMVLNAQGRIQGDLWVWRGGDQLELAIAADQFDKLLAHLNHFIIMDDVELVPLEAETALGLTGPSAGEVLARAGLPALHNPLTHTRAVWSGIEITIRRSYGVLAQHFEIWAPAAILPQLWPALRNADASLAGSASLEAFRIAEGIPAYGIDIAERDLPQETSQMRALSFNKGCYLGQEIVERIRSRGSVHRHLRHLELSGPVPPSGTELFAETVPASGKGVGSVTSAAALPLASGNRVFALAMVRAEAGDALHYSVKSATGTARLLAASHVLRI